MCSERDCGRPNGKTLDQPNGWQFPAFHTKPFRHTFPFRLLHCLHSCTSTCSKWVGTTHHEPPSCPQWQYRVFWRFPRPSCCLYWRTEWRIQQFRTAEPSSPFQTIHDTTQILPNTHSLPPSGQDCLHAQRTRTWFSVLNGLLFIVLLQ